MPRYANILETIGRTPLVRLNALAPEGVNLYAKVESFNPLGSVKDRMAAAIIEDAEARGALRPGQTVIEATSGNTGISLAMVCAQKGYPLVVTMSESFSLERRRMLRFLGARIVLTPAAEKGTGMLNKAVELAEAHDWFLCRQFDNEINAGIHARTTAPEIIEDMGEERLDVFVTGFGTGGTLLGTARGLKAHDPSVRIVAAEPDNAQVLGSGIPQPRGEDGRPSASHPNFRPHPMQGWAPDFISRLTETAVGERLIDEVIAVSGDDALALSRKLARREGIFAGVSSGATLAAALNVAKRSAPGSNIVCMLPDTAERYLSTPLFADIGDEMTEDELAISRSTSSCRFDAAATPAPAPVRAAPPSTDEEAAAYVDAVIADNPVVVFSLEWCEFCWTAGKLFSKIGVDFRSVDLDSVAYQKGDLGGRIRTVLKARIGSPTIPQIFIGGTYAGGCTDVLDAWREGTLPRMLDAAGVRFDANAEVDPYSLLPAWVHSRKSA